MANGKGVELVGVRVTVLGGGCSGLSYDMDFESELEPDDLVFGDHPKIFVDKKSHEFLDGTILDFTGGLKGVGFVFRNPNANSTCGCGSSFSV
jgi:iron-sulfur cluster assembly protein